MSVTKLNLIDFEEYFDPDKVVTNPDPIKAGEFTSDGLFSEEIFGPEQDVGNTDVIGWIDFGEENYVLHPLVYFRLEKLMGAKVVEALCEFNVRIDKDGNFAPELDGDGKTIKAANIEDANTGLWELKKNFPYYLNKYTKKDRFTYPEYRHVLRWYLNGKAFINKLPVFSPKLRPAQIFKHSKSFEFSEINKYYNLIIQHSNNLKEIPGSLHLEEVQLQKIKILTRLQKYVNQVADSLIESIKGKSGVIRKNIMAARVNFSNRSVIIPNPNLAVNEVVVSYTTFINLYKIPLINLVAISEGKTYLEAQLWVESTEHEYSPKMFRYMQELINKSEGGLRAILNRNPSISLHSIQIVQIMDVTNDIDDYSMQVSNNILSGLGGDYDGDVLNLIALFAEEQYEDFKILDPVYQVISNNDGAFNRVFAPSKDNKLALYLLNFNDYGETEIELVD